MPILVLLIAIVVIAGLGRLLWRAAMGLVLIGTLVWLTVAVLAGSDTAPTAGVAAALAAALLAASGRRSARLPARGAAPARAIDHDAVLWRGLRRELGWSGGRRLADCRDRFDRFLLVADAAPFSPETEELAILVRRHVPGVVTQCLADCRTASPDERRARLSDTLAMLEGVAARAERRRAELWAGQSGFDVYRARFNAGSEPG